MTRCSYKNCKSDSRKNKKIKFRPFPKIKRNPSKCLQWMKLCGNEKISVDTINKNTYICSKHFSGKFTVDSNPLPFAPVQSDVNDSEDEDTPEQVATILSSLEMDHSPSNPYNEKGTQTSVQSCSIFSYIHLANNEKHFKYFMGLNLQHFQALFSFLDPSVMDKLQYVYGNGQSGLDKSNLTNHDKLCLTLVRLKRGFTLDEMAYLSASSKTQVSRIFFTWIQFMFHQIESIRRKMFEGGRTVKNKPHCFKNFDGSTITMVIDATVIMTHSNSVKFLLGVCPSGAIMYVSEGFDGSISDKELFEQSDICEFLEENDIIMADRGFQIQDLCNEKNIKLYTPPMLMGRPTLTAEEKLLTKKIAKAWIYVKRAKGLIKSYRILTKKCPVPLVPIISNIFNVVAFLVNFEECLVTI